MPVIINPQNTLDYYANRNLDINELRPIVDNQYFLELNTVYSQEIKLEGNNFFVIEASDADWKKLKLKNKINFNIDFLSPSPYLNILYWISDEENGKPYVNKRLGLSPNLLLFENFTISDKRGFTTKGLYDEACEKADEVTLLDTNSYYVNFMYIGHNFGRHATLKIDNIVV